MSDAIIIADQEHATAMAIGSDMLLRAIRIGSTDRHNLIWRSRETTQTWKSKGFDAKRQQAAISIAHKEAIIANAVHRDTCTYCGVRADVGCAHRRAA